MTDWRKDHWRPHETDREHAERVEHAEREALRYGRDPDLFEMTAEEIMRDGEVSEATSSLWDNR